MRGNAWQITAIMAIILVVILIIPLVWMGRSHQSLVDEQKGAVASQQEAAQRAATLEAEVSTLKALIDKAETATDELVKGHANIMGKSLPGENPAAQTFLAAVNTLQGDLAREREAVKKVNDVNAQLVSDLNNEQEKNKTIVAQVNEELLRVKNELSKAQRDFRTTKEEYDQQLKEAQEAQNKNLDLERKKNFDLTEQLRLTEIANQDITDTNTKLTEMLEDVRNPNVEYPAGKIISVDQQAGLAVVNLGSADGLLVRTMFSVYHSSITGLSFRTAPVDHDPVYCDVCKREVARNASKASVEVMRILGPHRAEVRILDDILTDPIMTGDVVYSPIWRPGQKLRFALTAGMNLPGAVAGSEVVRRLIESNGGVIDCWIDETKTDTEEFLQGEGMTYLTNYIVVNEEATRNLVPEVANLQQGLLESARNKAIKRISLGDLLSRMGWKNVTPVYTFGSQTYTADSRVVPQNQGAVRASSGNVSPMFRPDNSDARVNAREGIPVRSSSGVVSPFFSEDAPPPPASSGKTSDLFRPRSPSTGNE